jgi:mannitol/fructose-specific phosphotransferase system IIA component (Ntr-type)
MSLVTQQIPVEFGHAENDPVDIIIALSIPQGYSIPMALDQYKPAAY